MLPNHHPEASEGVAWAGNDILPDALRVARREIPGGNFVLSDSANLTWVPPHMYETQPTQPTQPANPTDPTDPTRRPNRPNRPNLRGLEHGGHRSGP